MPKAIGQDFEKNKWGIQGQRARRSGGKKGNDLGTYRGGVLNWDQGANGVLPTMYRRKGAQAV